jgi:membrane protease YdiL (CAAX protease family)
MTRILRALLDDENRLHQGWRALVFFGVYWITLVLLQFPAVVLQLLLQKGASGFDFRLGTLIAALGALLATWICVSVERVPFTSVGLLMDRRWFRDFLWGSLGGIAIMAVTALAIFLAGGFHWTMDPNGTLLKIFTGIPFFLLVAVHEEVLFRGYPFQRLMADLGPWPAQILIAVLFALSHRANPGMTGPIRLWAFLNIGLAGVLLGVCYVKTRSLALPIGLHLGWNWAQGCLLGFNVSGTSVTHGPWMPVFSNKPQWLMGGPFGLEASLPCAIACSAAILLLLLWKPHRSESLEPLHQDSAGSRL